MSRWRPSFEMWVWTILAGGIVKVEGVELEEEGEGEVVGTDTNELMTEVEQIEAQLRDVGMESLDLAM